MHIRFSLFLLLGIFLLFQVNNVYAEDLYVNDFKSSYSGFYTYFGTCSPSTNGLLCTGVNGVYASPLSGIACLYGDFTSGTGTNQLMLWERAEPSSLGYGAIFYIPSIGNYSLGNYPYSTINSGVKVKSSGIHTYSLCKNGDSYTTYVDGDKIQTEIFTDLYPNQIAFQLTPGSILTNFRATDDLPEQDELSVPLLKQTSEPWAGDEYDSALKWNPGDPRIYSWGCAMTSAAMVFNYHGLKKLPDGRVLDPGTLNAWLKSQPDGYVGAGATNWLALQRLSKQAKAVNNITTFNALQYKRTGFNISQLTNDIKNNIPGILQVHGHFIVAKGITENTFSINDPFYNRLTLKDGYNSTFSSLGRFVPSFTDLSYIMLTAEQTTDITVTDADGNNVGEQFIESPIINPEDNTQSSTPVKMFYLAEPTSGTYYVQTSTLNNKSSKVSVYMYDIDGNVNVTNINSFGNAQFTIAFNKDMSDASNVLKEVTFQSTRKDVDNALKQQMINSGLAISLNAILYAAERHDERNKFIARKILEGGLRVLTEGRKLPKLISEEAYEVLSEDFKELIEDRK
jgi:hypothetical protein